MFIFSIFYQFYLIEFQKCQKPAQNPPFWSSNPPPAAALLSPATEGQNPPLSREPATSGHTVYRLSYAGLPQKYKALSLTIFSSHFYKVNPEQSCIYAEIKDEKYLADLYLT